MFLAWVDKMKADKDSEFDEEFDAEMKNILSKENFNNRLIKELIGNRMINNKLLRFLLSDAGQEVKYSRINDKESHYEAIDLYIQLLQRSVGEEGSRESIKNGGEGKSTNKEEKSEEKDDIVE